MQLHNTQASGYRFDIKYCFVVLATCLSLLIFSKSTFSESNQQVDPAELIKSKEIGFSTTLGAQLPLQTIFIKQDGKQVKFGELLTPQKPTLLVPMYFGCPRLCGLLTEGFLELIKELELKLGQEYNIVFLSFDPTEDSKLASEKAVNIYAALKPIEANVENISLITGTKESIASILDAAGYKFKFVAGEYLHSSGFFVLTPEGQISQYFTGIQFAPWDVRLSIVEASKGAIGSTVDHILLYCFDFDPTKGKYTWVAFNILRVGTLLAVALFVIVAVLLAKRVGRRK
jgi:protein SCO1/2